MGVTVLVIEDEQNITDVVRIALERDGYRVIAVKTGEEGLVELGRRQVALVVLDIGLPGMDGFEVCRRIRATSHLPIIMLTARDEESDRGAGLELGADDYVPKPFSPRELAARVKAVLRRSTAQPRAEQLTLADVSLSRPRRQRPCSPLRSAGTGLSDRVSYTPTLEARMDDIRAVLDAAGVERAALYGWGWGAPALAALFAATYPERTVALLLDGWLALRWAPDYPFGLPPEELDGWLSRLVEIWGDDDHALEIGQLTCGNRPEAGPWDDPQFVLWHAKLARFSATPGSFEAFEREEYETDVRDVARQVHVPTAILEKKGDFEEEIEVAKYNAALIPGARLIWVDGAAEVVMFDEIEAYTDAMIDFLRSVEDEERVLDRVLATVLFIDVAGATERAAEMGDAAWKQVFDRQNAAVRAMLARYRGNEVQTADDGFLATFDGPARAVKCAQAVCEAVKALGLEVRAGCHTGEIELVGDDVRGTTVEIGARVCAFAGPSEVLVTSTIKDLVAGSGLSLADRGERELEGLGGAYHLFAAM